MVSLSQSRPPSLVKLHLSRHTQHRTERALPGEGMVFWSRIEIQIECCAFKTKGPDGLAERPAVSIRGISIAL